MSRKRLPVWRTLIVMASDVAAIAVGLWFAYLIRFHSAFTEWVPPRGGFERADYLRLMPWAVLVWFAALRFENLYRRRSRILDFNVVRRIVTGSVLAVLVLIAWTFVVHTSDQFSRLFTLLASAMVVLALLANRVWLHQCFQWLVTHRGIGQSRTVVVGTGPVTGLILQALRRRPELGMTPVGVILARAEDASAYGPHGQLAKDELIAGTPVLGVADDLENLLQRHRVDEVILADHRLEREHLLELLVKCERALAVFRIVPEATELLVSGMTVETLDGIPLLGLRETPLHGWNAALKRMVDIAVAGGALVLTSPLLGALAWLVRRQDGQTAFYAQERMGIDGRLFKLIKLRTMRPDAEEESGPVFATDHDPRCTPLGRILRRTHLDELPQLLNVLRGEMSLVGPRPERPYFIQQFRDHVPKYMARHRVRSGITGWAQVNGLCGLHGTIDDRLQYDMYYIENWTLWLDLKILLMTLLGSVRPRPAAGN